MPNQNRLYGDPANADAAATLYAGENRTAKMIPIGMAITRRCRYGYCEDDSPSIRLS